jgi:aspartate dehydrogenase
MQTIGINDPTSADLAGRATLKVGLAGLGTIGMAVAKRLALGIKGLAVTAATARDLAVATQRLADNQIKVPLMPIATLAERCDVIVECAPAATFRSIVEPALTAGRTVIALSVGALFDHMDLVEHAAANGGRILVPTGALLGLDAVRAAAEGEIRSVRLTSRKPPAALAGASYLVAHGINLGGLTAPVRLFEGSARDAVRGFPANVNVAAALALAGIGPDRTRIEIWADPGITRNIHHVEVEADAAHLSMTIENVPSTENPRTGRITALSVIACLRGLVSELKIGT